MSSTVSLDYDGANNFSFCKRKHRRKYGLMDWSNYSAKFCCAPVEQNSGG